MGEIFSCLAQSDLKSDGGLSVVNTHVQITNVATSSLAVINEEVKVKDELIKDEEIV